MIRKILLVLVALIVLAFGAAAAYVASRQNLKFEAPYPQFAASTDSAVVERGRYVVRDVVNCASCHGDPAQRAAFAEGADVPLSGGFVWDIPPGKIYSANITSDQATGIGAIPDSAIARAMRYGVGHDGRALLPFMELQGLSDEDLIAVISYLRTQEAVPNPVPAHQFNILGKVVKATILANPVASKGTPPQVSPRGATVENGRYLVESVALCWACHTQRNPATGELVGARYAGATGFIEPDDPERTWSPPNITSDPETGSLGKMSEDQFVARFRAGRAIPGSPMPWQALARMPEEDLRAMYKYLASLPPVKNDVGAPVGPLKKKE